MTLFKKDDDTPLSVYCTTAMDADSEIEFRKYTAVAKCEYCGQYMSHYEATCEHCGAPPSDDSLT